MPDNATGELTPEDVATFTKGRLDADDDATAMLLAIAVAAARRYCGWHVTPVRTEDALTVDGPGSAMLVLPTLRMTALTSVTEDGAPVDLSTLVWSARGLVRKKSGTGWSDKFGSIEVKMSHGFAEAPDWQAAVLSMVDRISEDFSLSSSIASRLVVGPFEFPEPSAAAGSAFTMIERAILDSYALEKSP